MKRKLVKQGAATLMISLPSKWLRGHELGKGDEIEMLEKNNSLVISSESKKKQDAEITINSETKEDIKNILTHLYRNGYDKIIIKNTDQQVIKQIKTVVSNILLGFEFTKKTPNLCVIENISEPTHDKYDSILKRVFLIIKETQEIVAQDSERGFKDFNEIQELRDQQDRLILFCRRLIIKEKAQGNPLLNWELLTFLMHIQHSYFYLYKYAYENKVKASKEIIDLLKELINYFNLFYEAYYDNRKESIYEINKLKTTLQFGRVLKAIEKSKSKEAVILSYIREIFRMIQVGTSPIRGKILENLND